MTTNTPENSTNGETCQFCGAEATFAYQDDGLRKYACDSHYYPITKGGERTPLCIALEAKNKAEAELAEIKRDYHQPEICNERVMKLEAELAEVKRNPFGALSLIADIRAAVGDPTGKLMQDDLVEHCRNLRDRAEKAEAEPWTVKVKRAKSQFDHEQAETQNTKQRDLK